MMNDLMGMYRSCPACGKRFAVTCREDEWGYAYGAKLTCSYHCMRDMERWDNLRQPRYIHPGAMLYKRRMMGRTLGEILNSGTAKQLGLKSKQDVREYLARWKSENPREAQQIEDVAKIQLTHIRRTDIAKMLGVASSTVSMRGAKLGFLGRKCCGAIYYTPQEADAIMKAGDA